MTHSAFRVSAIALGVAALVSLSPLSAASAETVPHPTSTAHGQVAHAYSDHYTRRYVQGNGHRYDVYGYGYNGPAAATTGPTGPGTSFATGCQMCRI